MRIRPIPAILPLYKAGTRYRVAHGGRGSGKSYGVAQRFVTYALREKCRILCTKETQNSLSDSALAIMKRVIGDMGLDGAFVQTKHGLTCVNGTEFIFRGLQHPERIKSLDDIKYCWVEEAHTVTQDAWDILTPTVRADGSEIWVTFNADREIDPAYAMFVTRQRPDATVVKINWMDNKYFPAVLKAEMEYDRKNDYDKYLWVWEGNCRRLSDALIFGGKFRVDTFEAKPGTVFRHGADWGFSQDPSVLVRCYIEGDVLYIDHEAYGVGVDIDKTPELFAAVPDAKKWPVIADSARPETISYMRRQGYDMRGAKKGKGSVEDGIQFLRSFREIVIHERCKRTLDEMKLYSYKTDRLTGQPTPIPEDAHNHCIDALRYALEPIMKGGILSVSQISAGELGL